MIRNYLKTALRALVRQKGYAFINISGLAVSLAACLLIVLYVKDEFSYNQSFEKGDRVYRLVLDVHTPNGTIEGGVSALPFGPSLKTVIPEVIDYVRFHDVDGLFEHGDRQFQEERVLYTDGSMFNLFDFPLLEGDPATALVEPYSMVLTGEIAEKYFGRTDVVGETLVLDHEFSFTVTGVLDQVQNSHLQFDILLSFSTWEVNNPGLTENWTWFNFHTYLLLPDTFSEQEVVDKIAEIAEANQNVSEEEQISYGYGLEPLEQIYLHSDRVAGLGTSGNPTGLTLFSIIAGLILLIACINFMNLSTARSVQRAREVGVRKAVGAVRNQLVYQFLGESLFMSCIALALALLISSWAMPVFNAFTGKSLSMGMLLTGSWWLVLPAMLFGVGLLAGGYPALVLSHFKPIQVLKGRFATGTQGQALRKTLVVFQFSVSIILVVGTGVIYAQLEYLQQQDLGFDRDQILTVNFRKDAEIQRQYQIAKDALLRHPNVEAVTATDFTPGVGGGMTNGRIELGPGEFREDVFPYVLVDYDFLDTYGIELVAGRGFNRAFTTDATEAFLINEAAVRSFGWTSAEQALGKRVQQWGRDGRVVGVVRDFNYKSLHQPIEPLLMHIRPDWFTFFSLRVRSSNVHQTVAELEQIWSELYPQRPFEYSFLDAGFNRQYQAEERFGSLFIMFALLAVMVACLGLFGLSSLTIEQRTKEVGIRKVLGASLTSILGLLSVDYLKLMLVAFIIAVPISYIGMNRWLEAFAYRTSIGMSQFITAGVLVLLVVFLSVGYQSIRAARANPVDALRYE